MLVLITHCRTCFDFTLCREYRNEGLICDKCRAEIEENLGVEEL